MKIRCALSIILIICSVLVPGCATYPPDDILLNAIKDDVNLRLVREQKEFDYSATKIISYKILKNTDETIKNKKYKIIKYKARAAVFDTLSLKKKEIDAFGTIEFSMVNRQWRYETVW